MANKVALEDVQVKIIELFNEMTTRKGSEIIGNGCNGYGIKDVIKLGTEKLRSMDPFEELDPIMNELKISHNGLC